ncbi:hypothetical protein C8J56DRAFT_900102 [Mycena floridula]|nr:hypothetical protein C8J56DRAFT_900102 [Mycena floridula]
MDQDQSSYKDHVMPRGINYHYFFSPAESGKPSVIFLHGFPSSAYESWHHEIVFFVKKGYGVLAPDLLGYGSTDKPTETRGCALTSGLATFDPSRFAAFAFLPLGYHQPKPKFEPEAFYAGSKALAVSAFHSLVIILFKEDGADKIIADHIDAFMSILYPQESKAWLTDMGPRDKVTPPPSYLTEARYGSTMKTPSRDDDMVVESQGIMEWRHGQRNKKQSKNNRKRSRSVQFQADKSRDEPYELWRELWPPSMRHLAFVRPFSLALGPMSGRKPVSSRAPSPTAKETGKAG